MYCDPRISPSWQKFHRESAQRAKRRAAWRGWRHIVALHAACTLAACLVLTLAPRVLA